MANVKPKRKKFVTRNAIDQATQDVYRCLQGAEALADLIATFDRIDPCADQTSPIPLRPFQLFRFPVMCREDHAVEIAELHAELQGSDRSSSASVYKVSEWLTLARLQMVSATPNGKPLLKTKYEHHVNYHDFAIGYAFQLYVDIGRIVCGDSWWADVQGMPEPVTSEQLLTLELAQLRKLVELPGQFVNRNISRAWSAMRVEACLAKKIWEDDPRVDGYDDRDNDCESHWSRRRGRPTDPERDREIAKLAAAKELTHKRIGELYGISASAVSKVVDRVKTATNGLKQ